MSDVEDFIFQFEGNQREILSYLHKLFVKELELTDKIRFKIPFYYRKSWICYLNPIKDNKVELAFIRANELSNVQGLLHRKDRKQIAGIEFEKLSDIPFQTINEIIQEAILLDDLTPYKSKRKSHL